MGTYYYAKCNDDTKELFEFGKWMPSRAEGYWVSRPAWFNPDLIAEDMVARGIRPQAVKNFLDWCGDRFVSFYGDGGDIIHDEFGTSETGDLLIVGSLLTIFYMEDGVTVRPEWIRSPAMAEYHLAKKTPIELIPYLASEEDFIRDAARKSLFNQKTKTPTAVP